jgi:glycosyltransferase involved in cell wall biosynthesis
MPDKPDNSPPLRVLHLTAGSDAGGLSRYIFDLSFAMHAKGHQVAVAGQRGAWHWLFETAPFPWIDAPMKGGFFALRKSAKILSRWIDEHPIDILHVHYRKCALVGRQIQKQHMVPMLYTLHLSNIKVSWPWSSFSDFGDHTHVASKEAREWLVNEANVPQQLISVLPHGVDPRRFPIANIDTKVAAKEALGVKATDLVAAYVGRMDSPKNEEWMLDVADRSRDRLPNLKVIMVGEGPHEIALRRSVNQRNLQDRVVLLGHRDPMPIYHAADALLLPSAREGFSLVCAEAMSTGIPVLRTRTAGTDALVVENATGKSVAIDHDAFVSASIDFLSDIDGLKRMGALAAKHVHTHFSFDRQLKDTIDLYRSLVSLQGSEGSEVSVAGV